MGEYQLNQVPNNTQNIFFNNNNNKGRSQSNIQTKREDRVAIIRVKATHLFNKMQSSIRNLRESEEQSGIHRKKLSNAYQDDLDSLIKDYEDLSKQFVNDTIDVCQKSLKVFESLESMAQKIRNNIVQRA